MKDAVLLCNGSLMILMDEEGPGPTIREFDDPVLLAPRGVDVC